MAALAQPYQWTADEDAPTCQTCCARFSLLTRRHHCRRDGQVVCGDCSRVRAILPLLMHADTTTTTAAATSHTHASPGGGSSSTPNTPGASPSTPSGGAASTGAAAATPPLREVRLCVECVCELSAAWEGCSDGLEVARRFVHAQLQRPPAQLDQRRVALEVQMRIAQADMRALEQRGQTAVEQEEEGNEAKEEEQQPQSAQEEETPTASSTDAAAPVLENAEESGDSSASSSDVTESASVPAPAPIAATPSPFVSRMKAHASRLHSLQQELSALHVSGGLLLQVVLANATGSAAGEVWAGAEPSRGAAEGAPPTLNAGLYRWLIVTPPPSRLILISSLLYPPLPAAFRKPPANVSTAAAIQSQLQSLNLPPHLLDGTMEAARSLFNVFSSNSSVPPSPAQPTATPQSANEDTDDEEKASSELDAAVSPESDPSASPPIGPGTPSSAHAPPSFSPPPPPPLRFWSVRSLDAVSSIRPAEFRPPRGSALDRSRDPTSVAQPHRGFHIHFHPHAAPPPAGLMDSITNRRDESVLALWKQPWSCIVVDEGAQRVKERMIKEIEAQIAILQPPPPPSPPAAAVADVVGAPAEPADPAVSALASSASSSSSSSVSSSPLPSPSSAGPVPPPLPPRKHTLTASSAPVLAPAASTSPSASTSASASASSSSGNEAQPVNSSDAGAAAASATSGADSSATAPTPAPTLAPASTPAPAAAVRPVTSSPASSFFSSLVTAFKEATSSNNNNSNNNKGDSTGASGQAPRRGAGEAGGNSGGGGNNTPNQPVVPTGPPPPPTAAQLAAARAAECAWLVQQDAIQCLHSSSVGYYSALSASEKVHARRWVSDMKTSVSWDEPEHRQLLERLWAAYAPVLSPSSPTAGAGERQRPGSIAPPPFPGPSSERWKELGFQGVNPVTDFRGVGLLSLRVLVYLGERHPELTHVLMSLQSPQLLSPRAYPLACAIINLVCAVIGMMELDAPQQSTSNGAMSAREQARREELQGTAGQLLTSLNQSLTAVTNKWMNKDGAGGGAGAGAGADTPPPSLNPQEEHLNALMSRLDRNRLWRLCLRHKSRIAASKVSNATTAPAAPGLEEEDAAAVSAQDHSDPASDPATAAAAAAPRTPIKGQQGSDTGAPPAVEFHPASFSSLSSLDSVGELVAVLFPLLDDLWVESNASYFDFNTVLRQTVANVENVLLRHNPPDLPSMAAGVRALMKRNRVEREQQRRLAAQLAEKQRLEAQRKNAHANAQRHHRAHSQANAQQSQQQQQPQQQNPSVPPAMVDAADATAPAAAAPAPVEAPEANKVSLSAPAPSTATGSETSALPAVLTTETRVEADADAGTDAPVPAAAVSDSAPTVVAADPIDPPTATAAALLVNPSTNTGDATSHEQVEPAAAVVDTQPAVDAPTAPADVVDPAGDSAAAAADAEAAAAATP